MLDTLNFIKSFNNTDVAKDLSLEEVCDKYQASGSDFYIAAAFEKVFGLTMDFAKKHYTIQQEDVNSFALECVCVALQEYGLGDKRAKFTTFYSSILSRKLNEQSHINSNTKNCANNRALSYNDALKGSAVEDTILFLPNELTPAERRFCLMVCENSVYPTDVELAKDLGVTRVAVGKIRKQIQKKIARGLLTF